MPLPDNRTGPGHRFADRQEAGAALARHLRERSWVEPVVLGLARGGIPVAAVVARELDAPLDVAVARKIGAPGRPEFGIGAVTLTGPPIYDERSLRALGITATQLDRACEHERAEARRRSILYQGQRRTPELTGRDLILVDDGLATGVTATAALRALRTRRPRTLVFAAPAGAPPAVAALRDEADDVICLSEPEAFTAVGEWYVDFTQTTDDEVIELLDAAHGRRRG